VLTPRETFDPVEGRKLRYTMQDFAANADGNCSYYQRKWWKFGRPK
jgi:hypothetical protein